MTNITNTKKTERHASLVGVVQHRAIISAGESESGDRRFART
jgi:hypothetical protein